MKDETLSGRGVHQSERFKIACEQHTLAGQNLRQLSAGVAQRLSGGHFTAKEFQAFLDRDLAGLLGAVSDFMEKTNALRSAWEDGLVLMTDALEKQRNASEKLQKQIDLLHIEKGLRSADL